MNPDTAFRFPRHLSQLTAASGERRAWADFPPITVAKRGVHLFDQSAREYLDASRGAAVSCLSPTGGTIDGQRGDHVLVAPPFITTDNELEGIVERLGSAVEAAVALFGTTP